MKYKGSCLGKYVNFLHRFSFKSLGIQAEDRVGIYHTKYDALCSKETDCAWKFYYNRRDYCMIDDLEAEKEISKLEELF